LLTTQPTTPRSHREHPRVAAVELVAERGADPQVAVVVDEEEAGGVEGQHQHDGAEHRVHGRVHVRRGAEHAADPMQELELIAVVAGRREDGHRPQS
jgi:hypothetical protein